MILNFLKPCTMAESDRSSGNKTQAPGMLLNPSMIRLSSFISLFQILFISCFIFFFVPGTGCGTTVSAPAPTPSRIVKIELEGSMNPGMLQFFTRALKRAGAEHAELLLVILDTPGGLVRTLRDMIQAVMSSSIPVVVYVAPAGAQAASAGALFTMSAHVAAMAPGTNIGAAHPVIPGSSNKETSTVGKKMENDVAALARSIAAERGRDVKWAEEAVRKSVSATAAEALKLHIVDLTPRSIEELLASLNGMEVVTSAGTVRLDTRFCTISTMSPCMRERIMSIIADPDIAYILMMIGAAGLYFELAHPGVILPGVAGAIALVLGLFATSVLPVNVTGMLLLLLAMVLFFLELFIVSHGILGAAGLVSLLMGSLMLYDGQGTGVSLSASVMWPTVITVGGFFMAIAFLAARAQLRRPSAGQEGMIGARGVVRRRTGPDGGLVFVHGELWNAVSDSMIDEGSEIEVTEIHGMKLVVRDAADSYAHVVERS